MAIHLRKAQDADIPILIDLEESVAGPKTYSPMLSGEEWLVAFEIGVVYFIENDGEIVGSISYENKGPDKAHISGLVVDPKFQGRGFARQALEQLLKELKDKKRIDLVTHPDNEKALKLYQSLGFAIESKKENYFGDGEPRLVLVLQR